MPNLLASYSADGPGHDEMLHAQGATREAWEHLAGITGLTSWESISLRREDLASLLADQGIRSGVDLSSPWHLDPLPVIVDSLEWQRLEAGLAQRAMVLDAILADLYGPRRLLLDGVLPAEIVLGNPGFIRAADGTTTSASHQLFLTSTQIARNADGWAALGDSTDVLTGLGYAMADRRAVADVLAGAYSSISVQRLGPFFQRLRSRLDAIAPNQGDSPRVAMLVPSSSGATFDQAYLADTLGLPIVTPEDLLVADGRLWLRTLGDAEPIDVLLRHVPSIESDPVDLMMTAAGGVPGLIETAHSGSVALANPIGAGVLENPALLTYLPRVCRHVLGEDLRLPSVVTYWCGERSMGSHVVANLERLMVTSIASGTTINGWELSIGERADLASTISATPHLWVGQEPTEVSTTPNVGDGSLSPLPTTIHTYAVAEEDTYAVLPGGFGSTAGGAPTSEHPAKDVWVLAGGFPVATYDASPIRIQGQILAAGSAANLFDFGTELERCEGVLRLARSQASSTLDPDVEQVSMERVTASLEALAHSAHLVRDRLTPEAWRALSVLEQPAPIARYLVNVMALSGVIHESVTHDHSWTLLMLGKRLERARFVLDTALETLDRSEWTLPVPANSATVANFLRLHDSLLSFRRHNQFRAAIPSLIELLLLSLRNPRSLAYCIDDVARLLEELPSNAIAGATPAEIIEKMRQGFINVELQDHTFDRDELSRLLVEFRSQVDELDAAIRAQQFRTHGTAIWSAEVEAAEEAP